MTAGRGERLAIYRAAKRRYHASRREIEQLSLEALASLPADFRGRLENVAIVVEDWPPATGQTASDDEQAALLGLYQGTPYGRRGTDYHLVAPDRITLYRGPLLALCRTRVELEREVRDTVLHEVGHYFGLEDDELPR